ncbi:hypothetical protein, partial [Streptomyces pristinaespiralis]|uniref:hypothetical protein n=1 Tax=Streptomyces pristinaespiralis TaxID=38300 RepID=UPI00056996FD
MRGVLHRVVEDQGPPAVASLAVFLGQLAAGEQLGDGHGRERGDTGTEEADSLGLTAGGAAVLLGVLVLCAVLVPEFDEDAAVRGLGDLVAVEEDLLGVEAPQPFTVALQDQDRRLVAGAPATAARPPGEDPPCLLGRLTRGGRHQRPDPALGRAARRAAAVDLLRRADQGGRTA